MEPMTIGSPTSPPAGGFSSFNHAYGAKPLYNYNTLNSGAAAGPNTSLHGANNPPASTQPAPFLPNYLLGYEVSPEKS